MISISSCFLALASSSVLSASSWVISTIWKPASRLADRTSSFRCSTSSWYLQQQKLTDATVLLSVANPSTAKDLQIFSGSPTHKAGLWVRNHFLRIRIQQFFWMRIRIQLSINADPDPTQKKKKKKNLCRVFGLWKRHKRLLKSKEKWRLCKFTLKIWINLQLLPIFLHIFCSYLTIFSSWIRIRILNADPDLGVKINADPCGSGYRSTALK